MQIFPPRAVGARPISDTQLGAKIRTQKDNLAESPVVPNQPRSDASKEYDRSHRYSADSPFAAFRAPVPRPQYGSWQKSQHGTIRQRRDPPQQAELETGKTA